MNRIILTDNAIRVVNVAYVEKLIDATALREITTKIRELPDGLVRCKDCKYADVLITGNIYCKHFSEWHLHGTDWFCANAERKDDGKTTD